MLAQRSRFERWRILPHITLNQALESAEIRHAFERARATIDIDLNLFIPTDSAAAAFDALPKGVVVTAEARTAVATDGQARLWWGPTPVDVFFNTTPFHDEVAKRCRHESFGGTDIPFLACRDLAVFKAFFNRTKDWADLEAMAEADSLDIEAVLGVLAHYLGTKDARVSRLRNIDPTPR